MSEEQGIRLNKYLSEMGICSRREADRLVEAGKVTVDGEKATIGMKVTPNQKIVCDGKNVGRTETGEKIKKAKPVLLVVNKPQGIVCSTTDNDRAENIVEFLKYPTRIYPVGRLDKDSEGLLLMTNQGDLVNKIMRAGNAHEKEYLVKVNKVLTPKFVDAMAAGVELKELKTTTRPCKIEPVGADLFKITLTQGLNRQIRRMCKALGYKVLRLQRTRIMNIRLNNLKSGDCRRVTPKEYTELLELLEESSNLPFAQRSEFEE